MLPPESPAPVSVVDDLTMAGPERPETGAEPGRSGPNLPPYRLRRVIQYIEEHRQRPIPLAELSAVVHMSPYHFARLFTRSVGVPPHRFIVQCRIQAARALLTSDSTPIAAIARLVGFRTPSHFATTFRRLIGVTPSAYRRGRSETSEAGPAGRGD